jgi:hypothetical protein
MSVDKRQNFATYEPYGYRTQAILGVRVANNDRTIVGRRNCSRIDNTLIGKSSQSYNLPLGVTYCFSMTLA